MKLTRSWGAALFFLFLACSGTDGRSGVDQPLLVHDAQFVEGELPGSPIDSDSERVTTPTVTAATSEVAALRERLAGVNFFGLASRDATAVGVRLANLGEGYFLFPTGAVDAQDPDALTWSFVADLTDSLPAGRHELLTVAFDENGKAGPHASTSLCVRSLRPDNGNACFPAIAPPAVVISVQWDTLVDLDLLVVTPEGATISQDHPSNVEPGDPEGSATGNLTLDGNADCHIDGRQREDIVFAERPSSGRYFVYVNLARSCGETSVTYEVSKHIRQRLGDEEYGVASRPIGSGSLIADQANGGEKIGTFVGELIVK